MLKKGDRIKITGYNCGDKGKKRFQSLGILIGKEIVINTVQPLHGPLTISFGRESHDTFTIGRGLIDKLEYDVI